MSDLNDLLCQWNVGPDKNIGMRGNWLRLRHSCSYYLPLLEPT